MARLLFQFHVVHAIQPNDDTRKIEILVLVINKAEPKCNQAFCGPTRKGKHTKVLEISMNYSLFTEIGYLTINKYCLA
jgi:hypothetical protein